MINLVWLVPLLPLLGFLITSLLGKNLPKSIVNIIACGSVLISFIISLGIFFTLPHKAIVYSLFNWISAGNLSVNLAFQVDQLSTAFLLIITGVGFLIHLYSIGYMHNDPAYARYFSYLNLFVFFMLLLVLGSNYLVMFVGWEGVGLCSYLLIGFWFKKKAFSTAAKKAFIMNRIGDFGFLLGIIFIYITFGSLNYGEVFKQAGFLSSGQSMITVITLLLLLGATGKSAQIPLYTWLPDAMAGPTPVSALIHAATMVTAGVYMIARSNILYVLAPASMAVVATIGAVTALFAASIALTQNDIKKVLAYSTVSQLGYMFLALGVGSFTGGVFHVITHAFFKGLLFLCAGSVIHALSGEQDIRRMGGLKKKMPITFITFLFATLAISGIPPFAGFFSKDQILAQAFAYNKLLWFLGFAAALMTCFYMFRLLFLTFYGEYRGSEAQEKKIHEAPKVMTIPLIILAILSLIGGFIGVPEIFGGKHLLHKFLSPIFADASMKFIPGEVSSTTEWALMIITVLLLISVIWFTKKKYLDEKELPEEEGVSLAPLHRVLYHKYYIDELYNIAITKPLQWISGKIESFFENSMIDGFVNSIGRGVVNSSKALRLLQTGSLGFYIFTMVLSIILIFFFKSL